MRTTLSREVYQDSCPHAAPAPEIQQADRVRANQLAMRARELLGELTLWTSLDMRFFARHGRWCLDYTARVGVPEREGYELTGEVMFDDPDAAAMMVEQIRSGVLARIERDQDSLDVLRGALTPHEVLV